MTTPTRTRGAMLADLADAVNELVEPRHHTEYFEQNVTDTTTTRRGRTRTRTRKMRRPHAVTFPGLLESLRQASVPGAADTAGGTGSFESRPSAELEPTSVLRSIRDDVQRYAHALKVQRKKGDTIEKTLRALVSTNASDTVLDNLVADARSWVKLARMATGFDPAPITLNQPCPYCMRRHALVVTGDLAAARCQRCGTRWDHDTIGLLADMLATNEDRETVADVACWMPECCRRGVHDEHEDGRGHTWRDTCRIA